MTAAPQDGEPTPKEQTTECMGPGKTRAQPAQRRLRGGQRRLTTRPNRRRRTAGPGPVRNHSHG
eukprot:7997114-Lingulodinium_polyedra.AAC.1